MDLTIPPRLFREHGVCAAYIFGSSVQGAHMQTFQSDVDVAVLLSDQLSKERRFAVRLKLMRILEKHFQRSVDVCVINDISSLFFKYVILSEGKLIYEDPKDESDRVDFEVRTLGEYFDFQPFLKEYNKHYVARSAKL